MRILRALIAAWAALTSVPSIAATLIVDGSGKLTGATGVNVGGTLYDVSFYTGTCASVFQGCDEDVDFDFSIEADASAAAQALLDNVLIGRFDDFPEEIAGCTDTTYCNVWIPFRVETNPFGRENAAVAINYSMAATADFGLNDRIATGRVVQSHHDFDTENVLAVFRLSVVPAVPEPSTWAMMLVGFGTIGGAMRLKRRRDRLAAA